jgi:hypothetical protein
MWADPSLAQVHCDGTRMEKRQDRRVLRAVESSTAGLEPCSYDEYEGEGFGCYTSGAI